MLSLAVLVPDTPLLVPGAAGRAHVLDAERTAALVAARAVVRIAPDRVVVVASGSLARILDGPVQASLAAAGIADAELGWSGHRVATRAAAIAPTAGPAASVALLLLASAGWAGPVTVVEVAPPAPAGRIEDLRALGRRLALGADRVALVVAGSLSARNGPGAPLAEDDRAGGVDAALLSALEGVGASSLLADLAATSTLDPLATVSGALAAELAVTAWAPLQVLLGAAEQAHRGAVDVGVRHVARPFGVTYVVATWHFGIAAPAGAAATSCADAS